MTRSTNSDPILSIDGLTRRFGGLTAVDGVNFEIYDGEIVGLIGPNGAGKTTIFDCITGVRKPHAGTVIFNGEEIQAESPEDIQLRGLIRAFQEPRVFSSLSVTENMKAAQHRTGSLTEELFDGQSSEELDGRIEELLEFVELSDKRGLDAEELSHGQKKLLQLGMVLVSDPDLILLDEPTAGVNPATIEHISELIRSIKADGTTILLIEHNMDVIMDLSERIYALTNGRILAEGSPEDIQTNDEVLEAYLGGGT
jgi:ABC-type branched-subunit amino acid transport system ATPase component